MFCSVMSQVMGSMTVQSPPLGQQITVELLANSRQKVDDGQQKFDGKDVVRHGSKSVAEQDMVFGREDAMNHVISNFLEVNGKPSRKCVVEQ